jgi:flagellar biosynthesis protein FliR
MLDDLLRADLFAFLLIFARVGAAISVLPGFGDPFIAPRVRLMLALPFAAAIAPLIGPSLPAMPDEPLRLGFLIGQEVIIGLFLGLAGRFAISSLHLAGTVMAMQSSLSSALFFDPASAQQGILTSAFLTLLGTTLIFATNLHHMMLATVVDSYALFPAAEIPEIGDLAEATIRLATGSFTLGLQIAAPFIVLGIVFSIGLGALNRLMPQLQVFFVAMPLQVLAGIALMAVSLVAAMSWFLTGFTAIMQTGG